MNPAIFGIHVLFFLSQGSRRELVVVVALFFAFEHLAGNPASVLVVLKFVFLGHEAPPTGTTRPALLAFESPVLAADNSLPSLFQHIN